MRSRVLAWILTAIETLAPADKAPPGDLPETTEERAARHEAFAVALEGAVDRVLGPGATEDARIRLARLGVAVPFHESGFRLDVHRGVRRGDRGRSFCEYQIHLGRGKTEDGWRGADLEKDPAKCAIVGVRAIQRSLNACRALPWADRLSAYASGSCVVGIPAARRQMAIAARLVRVKMPPEAVAAMPLHRVVAMSLQPLHVSPQIVVDGFDYLSGEVSVVL